MAIENANGTEIRFKNPGQLLLVVIGFLLWAVGFIDLIGHTSAEPDVFGLYSLPFFIFIIVYGLSIAIWIVLFFNSRILSRVVDVVRYIQSRTWLALLLLVGLGVALWIILEWDRWSRLPGLQFAAFGLVILAALVLLFSNWRDSRNQQRWRRVVAYPLAVLVILEAIIQIVAWIGALPGIHAIGGDFVPYERIYYNLEGSRNGRSNRYGWHFPDFKLNEEKRRVLVVGGSHLQALQVLPEQELSAHLSELITQNLAVGDTETEIVSIGLSGFGLSPFLFEDALSEIPDLLAYDEIVVLFHLGDDFQSPTPSHNSIAYTVGETYDASVRPSDARLRHDLTHYYLRGYMSFQLVETIRSNYLTPKVIPGLFHNGNGETRTSEATPTDIAVDFSRLRGFVTDNYTLTEPGHAGIKSTDLETITQGNNFMFNQDGNDGRREALLIADSLLQTAQEITAAKDITLRVVTIPAFPETFYSTFHKDEWQPQIGEYDLFLPENALMEIASKHNIPILPMGQYILRDRLTVEEIRALYFYDNLGHFTPLGHEYFANAINACFYSDDSLDSCLK
jgi:hypothetical protein